MNYEDLLLFRTELKLLHDKYLKAYVALLYCNTPESVSKAGKLHHRLSSLERSLDAVSNLIMH